ncbi:hypothetical protein CR513_51363, partial [Mucuna pruriens]
MSSLQACVERFKRRHEEPLEQVLNVKTSLKENGEKIKGNVVMEEDVDMDTTKEGRGDHDNFDNNERSHKPTRGRGRGRGRDNFGRTNERRTNVEEKVNLVGDKEEDKEPTLFKNICGCNEKFVELKEKVKGNVYFGDSSKVQIQEKSTILISLKDGSHKFIKDVFYVPKLRNDEGDHHISHPYQLSEACLLGKHTRKFFLREAELRANESLQLVHINVFCPIDPPSFGKINYFLLFIDDFSRKICVNFVKNFKTLTEKESDYVIKVLRYDKSN